MATANVARAAHATLSTTTVDTVNFSDTVHEVCVINRSGTTDLTVTWAVNGTATTPVAVAAETLIVPQGQSLTFQVGPAAAANSYATQVKVLGNGNAYSVQGLS